MKVKLDIYSDTFRSGIIGIPDEAKGWSKREKAWFLERAVGLKLTNCIVPREGEFIIITAKIHKGEGNLRKDGG